MLPETVHVLILEDNKIDYMICSENLKKIKKSSYKTYWAQTIDEATSFLESQPIDCCLIDYNLGTENGIEFLEKVSETFVNTPFILLTSMHEQDIDIHAMEAGATNYINKDKVDSEILERSIRYALTQKSHQKKLAAHLKTKSTLNHIYEDILDDCPFGIWDISSDNKTVYINEMMQKIFQVTESEVKEKKLQEILKPEHYDFITGYITNKNNDETIHIKMNFFDEGLQKNNEVLLSKSISQDTGHTLITAIHPEDLHKIQSRYDEHRLTGETLYKNKNNVNLLAEFEARHLKHISQNFSSNAYGPNKSINFEDSLHGYYTKKQNRQSDDLLAKKKNKSLELV